MLHHQHANRHRLRCWGIVSYTNTMTECVLMHLLHRWVYDSNRKWSSFVWPLVLWFQWRKNANVSVYLVVVFRYMTGNIIPVLVSDKESDPVIAINQKLAPVLLDDVIFHHLYKIASSVSQLCQTHKGWKAPWEQSQNNNVSVVFYCRPTDVRQHRL